MGAANRQSPTIRRKFALYQRTTKLWMRSVKRDKATEMPPIKSVGAADRQSPTIPGKFVALYHMSTKLRMRSDERDKVTPPQRQCDQGRKISLDLFCLFRQSQLSTLAILATEVKPVLNTPWTLPPSPRYPIKYLILKTIV